jgi:methylglyoxal synthase
MIALIAHDRKKLDLTLFVRQHVEFFRQVQTVATHGTGQILRDKVGIDVEQVTHGPDGGDLIIGGRIAQGIVRAVIFFRDPLTAQPHEPDVSALLRVCDVHNVPLATNLGTAEAIVDWLKEQLEEGRDDAV